MAIFFRLVLPAQCATNFNIKGECRNGFEKMVKMLGEMEEVCQDWAIKNLQGDIAELEKFKCIIGNKCSNTFFTLPISIK